LGVRHPAKAGTFLLGIECDGASYHSGRSARDRDRLRQEILENLGWKIHRIWSTDWFKSRESEIKRLLRRIEEILESDPTYRKEQEKASRTESLRQRLITLREMEIKTAFPDTPPEKGLLTEKPARRVRAEATEDERRLVPQNSAGVSRRASIRSRWGNTSTACWRLYGSARAKGTARARELPRT
jgi:hypothetical protein